MLMLLIASQAAVQISFGQGNAGNNDALVIRKCADFNVTGDGNNDQWNKTDWVFLSHQGSDFIDYKTRVKVLSSTAGISARNTGHKIRTSLQRQAGMPRQ